MATRTLGTLSTSSLTALQFVPGAGSGMAYADIASINNSILEDLQVEGVPSPLYPRLLPPSGQFSDNGLLFIPGRGTLKMQPGDWVAVDLSGFPFLIPGTSLPITLTATATTVTSSVNVSALSTNINTLGWRVGMLISGVGLHAGNNFIASITGPTTFTLSQQATTGAAGTSLTVGTWTHS